LTGVVCLLTSFFSSLYLFLEDSPAKWPFPREFWPLIDHSLREEIGCRTLSSVFFPSPLKCGTSLQPGTDGLRKSSGFFRDPFRVVTRRASSPPFLAFPLFVASWWMDGDKPRPRCVSAEYEFSGISPEQGFFWDILMAPSEVFCPLSSFARSPFFFLS